jgi:hypothetical protein
MNENMKPWIFPFRKGTVDCRKVVKIPSKSMEEEAKGGKRNH